MTCAAVGVLLRVSWELERAERGTQRACAVTPRAVKVGSTMRLQIPFQLETLDLRMRWTRYHADSIAVTRAGGRGSSHVSGQSDDSRFPGTRDDSCRRHRWAPSFLAWPLPALRRTHGAVLWWCRRWHGNKTGPGQ